MQKKSLLKKTLWFVLILIALPVLYFVSAFALSHLTVNKAKNVTTEPANAPTLFLDTNGMHLDVVIAVSDISPALLAGIYTQPTTKYIAFGWGDENFYLHTPRIEDVTVKNAYIALFTASNTLMHTKLYDEPRPEWTAVPASKAQITNLNRFINTSFMTDNNQQKIRLTHVATSDSDDFYKANGSYHLFYTCNTWLNTGFKQSGLPASVWTPFDSGLLNKYQ